MNRKFVATVCLAFACSCAASPASGQRRSSEAVNLETRVFSSEVCPGGTQQEGIFVVLAGLLLKPLVEAAVKGIGSALQNAGEEKKTQVSGRNTDHFYKVIWATDEESQSRLDLNVGCITVVHGEINPSASQNEGERLAMANRLRARFSEDENVTNAPFDETVAKQILTPYGSPIGTTPLTFTDDIRFYGDFEVQWSSDQTAVQLSVSRVLIGDAFASRKRFANGRRDVVSSISLHGPGQMGYGDAFAIANISLANVNAGTYIGENSGAANLLSGWFPLAPVHSEVVARMSAWTSSHTDLVALRILRSALELSVSSGRKQDGSILTEDELVALRSQKEQTEVQIERMENQLNIDHAPFGDTSPISIRATLTETQEGSKFLVDLGNLITENAAAVAAPVVDAIDPTKRAASAAENADEEDALRIAAIEAIAAFDEADMKIGEERSETAIRVERIRARQACRKLGAAGFNEMECLPYYD